MISTSERETSIYEISFPGFTGFYEQTTRRILMIIMLNERFISPFIQLNGPERYQQEGRGREREKEKELDDYS